MRYLLKRLFEVLGYSIKRIRNNRQMFEFPREFFPIEMDEVQKKIIIKSEKYSMTGRIRMSLLLKIIEHLNLKNIEGDIVECGVWKGGNLICAQEYLNYLKNDKNIIGFDTFEGMNKESDHDVQIKQVKLGDKENFQYIYENRIAGRMMKSTDKLKDDGKNIWAYCSVENVLKNIEKETPNNRIKLIKGPVEETLTNENNLPDKISLLRLDTDFYESTKIELEKLYPKLISGGFLIIDDYGHWKGAKKAVDDYFRLKKPFIHFVDESCRLIIKTN